MSGIALAPSHLNGLPMHRWDEMHGIRYITYFTAERVLLIVSEHENEAQMLAATQKFAAKHGDGGLFNQAHKHRLENMKAYFAGSTMTKLEEQRWDDLPEEEREMWHTSAAYVIALALIEGMMPTRSTTDVSVRAAELASGRFFDDSTGRLRPKRPVSKKARQRAARKAGR